MAMGIEIDGPEDVNQILGQVWLSLGEGKLRLKSSMWFQICNTTQFSSFW